MATYAQVLGMISQRHDTSLAAIARRLILLRQALGFDGHGGQVRFCQLVGIPPTTWNNYERGRQRIPPDMILRLKLKTGVTSDWVYFGDPDELPLSIARRLLPPDELAS